jgi:hypothetical protein
MRKSCSFFTLAVIALMYALFPPAASAHPTQFTTLQVMIDSTGQFQATLNIDILSYALGQTSLETSNEELEQLLDGPRAALRQDLADAGERFQREVVIHTDVGDVTPSSWNLPGLPELDAVLARHIQPRILVPGEIDFSGTLPAGARTVSIRLPYVLGDTVHVYELPDGGSHDEPVAAGGYSTDVALNLSVPRSTSRALDFGRYVTVGFKQMIPQGLDHVLFVLGFFLLSTRMVSLLWQVAAFTGAHSIALVLSTYGVIHLSPSITGPLTAASVVCIAIENLFTSELKPWRTFAVFGFGLIHGLGFAHALAQAGLPHDDFFIGLLGFNVGIECGQLAVIMAAFSIVGWFRECPWYRRVMVIPASALIAVIGTVWTLQRIFWS